MLLIIVESLNKQLGGNGNKYMYSQNIDTRASQGMEFEWAYVQQAVCAASRVSLFTGLYPQTRDVDYPYSYYFVEDILPKYDTLMERFYNNGYYTGSFEKIQHGIDDNFSATHFKSKNGLYMLPDNIEIRQKKGGAAVALYEMADISEGKYPGRPDSACGDKGTESQKTAKETVFFLLNFSNRIYH